MLACFFIDEIGIKHGVTVTIQISPVQTELNVVVSDDKLIEKVTGAVFFRRKCNSFARVTESYCYS